MAKAVDSNLPPGTTGLVLHGAALYDLMVWVITLGRERSFREKILRLARLQPGDATLDVGCGTGSLAIAAKKQVGPAGRVFGIDASREMLARAERKAKRAGLDVTFRQAAAQTLPFPDRQFDVVLSTLMLHHLPRKARAECAREIGRVLKPGGHALAVDFGAPTRERRRSHIHLHQHGGVDLADITAILSEAGLQIIDSGAVGYRSLNFALAKVPK